ncbi:hypothetical protein D9613_003418 [Agrocybe pediades]|uniref:F-box domain-containing protein n=1 Tax=Agrocybe pediades TaxID=84607 RepID=A0A8H4VNT1_9AGAR|nr:hypothetical protein D9613_003418 [Agrocybe pediades]
MRVRDASLHLGCALRDEEVRICAMLAIVRRKLNELSPIAMLPPEILEEVFHICVSWLYDSQKPKHRLAWTQVCCSWRRISLESSRLWRRIDLCEPRFADEFLVRSRQAPLSVVCASPLKTNTPVNLALHANRLRTIDVFLYPEVVTSFFSSVGPTLCNLTNLSLKVPPLSPTVYLPFSIPLLRYLNLDGVAVPWDDCRNLTHLSLRSLSPELCPSIKQVHDICSRSPNLEHIRLEGLVPSCLEVASKPPVSLVNLKEVIISGDQHLVSTLLSGLALGPAARIRLFTSLTESLHSLFPQGRPWVPCDANTVRTISLSRNGAQVFKTGTQAWSRSEEPNQLLFSLSSAVSVKTHISGSLSHLFDLSNVTKLELNTGFLYDVPVDALKSLLDNLPNLETICTAFNDLEGLFAVLRAVDPSSGRVYAPKLKNLSFSKPSDLWFHFKDRWLAALVDVARFRHLSSHPIHTVEFLRCQGISEVSIAELQDIVPHTIVTLKSATNSGF